MTIGDTLDQIEYRYRRDLLNHLAFHGEAKDDIVGACAKGYDTFTVWTETRVYFPATYDGDVWVTSVPRNPCDEAKSPVGG